MDKLTDRGRRVEEVARWWTEATQEQRAMFLQRFVVHRATKVKNPNAPTQSEIELGILLAEASEEANRNEAGAIGERLRGR